MERLLGAPELDDTSKHFPSLHIKYSIQYTECLHHIPHYTRRATSIAWERLESALLTSSMLPHVSSETHHMVMILTSVPSFKELFPWCIPCNEPHIQERAEVAYCRSTNGYAVTSPRLYFESVGIYCGSVMAHKTTTLSHMIMFRTFIPCVLYTVSTYHAQSSAV